MEGYDRVTVEIVTVGVLWLMIWPYEWWPGQLVWLLTLGAPAAVVWWRNG